ncbi:MAG: flagellar biosynthesis regulator FlaF [Alphaproteobacteria bacterium]|nr:flagellar biosynthesis regulator FlaF [Alphaproteobacteria bacterium]
MSLTAYQRTLKTVEAPRDTEYRLFTNITRALVEVRELPRTDKRVIAAIGRNRQLWTTLASDCSDPGNQLPQGLRAQIISLSLWVGRYSSKVMREGATIDPLVDINRTIMQGLEKRT